MSSTTTTSSPFPSTSPPGGPSPPQNNNGSGGPSSSLYLFTFLATLFLLLFVSSAIIVRSFILRRRFRRRIEGDLLAGLAVPNQTGRVSRRRALGEKPKLWETRVLPADGDRWDSIVPVSAVPKASEAARENKAKEAAAEAIPRPLSPFFFPPPRRLPLYQRLLRNPFSRRAGSLTPPPAAPPTTSTENSFGRSALPSHDRMQVTVLIAMPDPRRPHLGGQGVYPKGKDRNLDFDYDEDDLPEMVLGMVDPRYKDAPTPPRSS